MQIEKNDIDSLNAKLSIELEPGDYEARYTEELQKQGKKMSLKGFRKGKVPKSYLKKVLGKSVLAEVVFDQVNRSLSEYIEENKLKLLGGPIPSDDQSQIDFDPDQKTTYNFSFDIAFEPEFELAGVGEEASYEKVVVEVTDAMIDEEIDKARKRLGKEVEIESGVEDNDRIELASVELEGGKEKEDGLSANIKLLVSMIADKKLKSEILDSKLGDSFSFNPYDLEKDASEHHVKHHILSLEDDSTEISTEWKGDLTKIIRIAPADLDEEFFKKYFGEENGTEEKAREILNKEIGAFYNRQGEALLFRSFQDRLLKENDFDLPEGFMKKWLESQQQEEQRESMTDEAFQDFIKGLRWTIIRDKIGVQGEVEVQAEEIQHYFMAQIRQYMGPYGADENLLQHSAQRLMQDNEQVRKAYETIKDDKVFQYIASQVKTTEKSISNEELEAMIESVRQ